VIREFDEAVRSVADERFGDAVTFAWGDPSQGLYGTVRLGFSRGRASAMALLFGADGPVASAIEGGQERPNPSWSSFALGDVGAEIVEPLRSWHVSFDGDEGGYDLHFSAVTAPLEFGPELPAAAAASLHGYEQVCRVEGTVRVGSARTRVSCLGQRGHQWGEPDWDQMSLTRTVSAWIDEDTALTYAAVRPAGAEHQDEEAVSAWLVLPREDGPEGLVVDDPRLSTVYDVAGRQRRAGFELWPDEDSHPHRMAGEAVCGTSIELGRLRLDTAFFTWRMDGATGTGRYDVLRRTDIGA
jgi:hypothetical protein